MIQRTVSGRRVIEASAADIFSVLADPAQHAAIDGSGLLRSSAGSSTRLSLGDEFEMRMRAGAPYRIVNRVVEFDEPHLIAWEVHPGGRARRLRDALVGGHRWRYRLSASENGTLVEEEFDYTTSRMPRLIQTLRFPARNAVAIERTLDRLEQHFSTSAATD